MNKLQAEEHISNFVESLDTDILYSGGSFVCRAIQAEIQRLGLPDETIQGIMADMHYFLEQADEVARLRKQDKYDVPTQLRELGMSMNDLL